MDKTIRRVRSFEEQRAETYRYWRSRPIGERMEQVWDATESAYALKGIRYDATEDMKQLWCAFNVNGVEYLIVGMYAVGVYSEPRATASLELLIRPDVRNSEAVYLALGEFGAPLAGVNAADFRDNSDAVFQIGHAPGRVDIVQYIEGVVFDELWLHRVDAVADGVPVHLISEEHLMQYKLESKAPQDMADVHAIREAGKAVGRIPGHKSRP
jgi:hypothetical protein